MSRVSNWSARGPSSKHLCFRSEAEKKLGAVLRTSFLNSLLPEMPESRLTARTCNWIALEANILDGGGGDILPPAVTLVTFLNEVHWLYL